MKFTNGYWLMRKEIEPNYAVEYHSHQFDGSRLTIYAPCSHIGDRGDALNIGVLTITLTSPQPNIIKVEIVHFKGEADKGPYIQVNDCNPAVSFSEDDNQIRFTSDKLSAVIDKRPNSWKISYYYDGKLLTDTSYRNMAHMKNNDINKCYMVEQLAIDVDEYIYGLGERFTPFIKNGQVVEIWNEDGGTASEMTYKNIPFYLSNKGYGVLVDSESDVQFEIGSEKVERVQFSVEGEKIGYYVVGGDNPLNAVENYTTLTGKPALPPEWSFGLWLTTSFTTNYDEQTTSHFIDGMAERDIPLHVFHFDCYWMDMFKWCDFTWDKKTFNTPKEMLERYHKKGLRICVWINPYISQQSALFDEAMNGGFLLKKTDGSVWQTDLWQPGMGIVDFTNPKAYDWYQSKLETLIDMGVDCFKTDFGERIPVKDICYYDGSDPVKMHNYYTYLYNSCVFNLLKKKRGENEAVLFARSATVGGQQFPAHWGGDCSATYPSMAETLRGGLSLACCGFGFWSHDISGFEQTAPADIYKRWCAFGLLSSHSRLHGSSSYRVPWLFDDEACEVLARFVKLKCELMPYLYGMAVSSHTLGRPVIRPMFMAFSDDKGCDICDKQYMLGDSLLVAPIFKEDGTVDYYLPKGKWINILTNEVEEGGTWHRGRYDYFNLPLMVKPASIIVKGAKDSIPDYDYTDGFTCLLSYFEDGDEAKTFIPDEKGNIVTKIQAKRHGNVIKVKITGKYKDFHCQMIVEEPGVEIALECD
ncbi:alpha-xylosidase [Pseudobutyrivibrio sp. MD2005]|uniref:alpha-xylosidase n=1 Tax=Pseudobutyrivibrio sp. MD2005 TaxID=1410616 RepID=UPI0004895B1B|nr:alpha-xylosidase [Pseudobutyrivibrio sp. MD2005]